MEMDVKQLPFLGRSIPLLRCVPPALPSKGTEPREFLSRDKEGCKDGREGTEG